MTLNNANILPLVRDIQTTPKDSIRQRLFDRFYLETSGYVEGIVKAALGASGPKHADDVVQLVYVKLIETGMKSFDSERGRFDVWLGTLSRNAAIDYMRKQGRKGRSSTDLRDPERVHSGAIPFTQRVEPDALDKLKKLLGEYVALDAVDIIIEHMTSTRRLTEYPKVRRVALSSRTVNRITKACSAAGIDITAAGRPADVISAVMLLVNGISLDGMPELTSEVRTRMSKHEGANSLRAVQLIIGDEAAAKLVLAAQGRAFTLKLPPPVD